MPASSGTAIINNSGTALLPTTVTGSYSLLQIGTTSGGSGTINVSGGSLSGVTGALGETSDASGVATVTSGTWTSSFLTVGSSGTGSLLVNGGRVNNLSYVIGNSAGSSGSATVTSGTWTSGSSVVGNSGTGSLLVNGGLVTATTNAYVGNAVGSSGSATVTSGTWTSRFSVIGNSGTGSLLVNGGLMTSSLGVIANSAGSSGTATVSSGTWTDSRDLRVGASGSGSLAVSGGLVSVSGTVFTGTGSTGDGTITLSGSSGNRGTLSASRILEGSGTSTINLNGGILQARTNESDFLSGYEAGDVTIHAGGAFIDTNGFAIGINTVLSGSGALTKQGAGTLTLSGSSSYFGGTVVNSGTLAVGHNQAVGSGAVIVNSGAFLVQSGFTAANPVTLAGGTLVEIFAPGTNLTDTINTTSNVGGTNTGAALLEGTTTAVATIESSFAATSLATNDVIRLSDVFGLSGVPIVNIGTGETDLFVLQLQIADVTTESFLGWLDPNTNQWVNAVFGNIGGTAAFQGDGAYNPGTDFVLGYYGVDTTANTVWAVLNHNSDFAIVPEPSTFALLALGASLFFRRRIVRS